MARYKYIDTSPRFLPVDLSAQLLPGTFEHAAHHLLHEASTSRASTRASGTTTTGAPGLPAGDAPDGRALSPTRTAS